MAANDLALRVQGLSKRYRIGASIDRDESLLVAGLRGLAGPIRNFRRLRGLRHFGDGDDSADTIWALRDISFELHQGDVLGVVGRNGAGKSTLLKILARITEPTEGRAELRGRVSSLLEVGTGFHPDLTGRENVFLNGTMLGMKRREVAARFDEIVAFAEVEKFIDTPVKRYSSGMYVRLAFSVAAHLDPDILITDEVLAVGDAEFQRKCIGEMRSVAEGGRTVIFVSHNHSLVSSLCTRAIWLEQGRIRRQGLVDEVLDAYSLSLQDDAGGDVELRTDRLGSGRVRVASVSLRSPDGAPVQIVKSGVPVELVIRYQGSGAPIQRLVASATAETLLREAMFTASNRFTGDALTGLPPSGEVVCRFDGLALNEGDYMWTIKLEVDGITADFIADTARFHVDPTAFYPTQSYPGPKGGHLLVEHSWRPGDRSGSFPRPGLGPRSGYALPVDEVAVPEDTRARVADSRPRSSDPSGRSPEVDAAGLTRRLGPSGRNPVLEAARGVAAIGVVLYHVWLTQTNAPRWSNVFGIGWLGVQIFFVLSGLVLYLPYARNDRRLDIHNYAAGRVLRIVPAFWVALIAVPFAFHTSDRAVSAVAAGVVLLAVWAWTRRLVWLVGAVCAIAAAARLLETNGLHSLSRLSEYAFLQY